MEHKNTISYKMNMLRMLLLDARAMEFGREKERERKKKMKIMYVTEMSWAQNELEKSLD